MTHKTRILHVVHSLDIGGLERVVLDLAGAFQSAGHSVSICCLAEKGKLAERAEKAGIAVYALNRSSGLDPAGPWRVFRFIRGQGFDVVHTHNEAGLIYGASGAWLAGVNRIVHTEHGKEPGYDRRHAVKLAERILAKRVDHVVTVSRSLREKMAAVTGLRPERIHTVCNGIDHRAFQNCGEGPELRASLGIAPGDIVIGHIARLVPLKNQAFLLGILSRLLERGRRVRLVIVGSGPLRMELERMCDELHIASDVLFLGARTDIPALLSTFDLFLLPSFTEGISITLLEAMAAGVASLASNVGGNPEIIENGENGFLLPVNDPEPWVSTIEFLIGKGEERKRIAQKGSDFVARRFSLESMASQYARLYGIGQ